MKTVLLFITFLLAGCTNTGIPLTAEQRAQCDADGCVVMTPAQFKANALQMAAEHLRPIYEQGVKDGAAEGCKKAAI